MKRNTFSPTPGILIRIGLLMAVIWAPLFVGAQSYDIFAAEAPVKVRMEFDRKMVIKKKFKEDYHDAKFTYTLDDGTTNTETIRIRARGEFRRKHCTFPPLTLNFKKAGKGERLFSEVNKLKLVTHCKSGQNYQNYLLKEYLVYKLYNQLTDVSFRVRLLEIDYINSRKASDSLRQYGFLIESVKELAARCDAFEIEAMKVHPNLTEQRQMNLIDIFQFMIGNTDYSVYRLHNIKLLKSNDFRRERPLATPYDLDYSGMVNTYYAAPDPILGIENVRQRIFWGYCQPEDLFDLNFALFQEKRAQLYAVINDFPLLDAREKRSMTGYLDSFYEILDLPASRQRYIVKACRTP